MANYQVDGMSKEALAVFRELQVRIRKADTTNSDDDDDDALVQDSQSVIDEQQEKNIPASIQRIAEMNKRQRQAFIMAITVANYNATSSSDDGGDGLSRCMIVWGSGGTGKAYVIDAIANHILIHTTSTENNAVGNNNDLLIAIMASTVAGNIASLIDIGGVSTLHDKKKGLSLPIGTSTFKNLEGAAEQRLKARFDKIKLLIVDKYYMLKPKELYYIGERLKQAKACHHTFGGLPILLMGDMGQLSTVRDICLWESQSDMKDTYDKLGGMLYSQFDSVIELQMENCQVNDSMDEEARAFGEQQGRIRDAKVTYADWELLITRSKDTIQMKMYGRNEWERQGFNNNDVTYLYIHQDEADTRNLHCLKNLKTPIARIEAKHTGDDWDRISPSNNFNGLEPVVYLCEGARVMMSNNELSKLNITNGTVGIVKSFKFHKEDLNANGTLKKPCVPAYVWVDFGNQYTGSSFFPRTNERNGWIPIYPKEATYCYSSNSKSAKTTRTMLPLKLARAWTIHKVQGQAITGKLVMMLGSEETVAGLTYVAISRAQSLENIGFVGGLSGDRVTTQLVKAMQRKEKQEKIALQMGESLLNSTNFTFIDKLQSNTIQGQAYHEKMFQEGMIWDNIERSTRTFYDSFQAHTLVQTMHRAS